MKKNYFNTSQNLYSRTQSVRLFNALLIALLLLISNVLIAQSQGPNYPDSGNNVNGPGTQNWSNAGDVISNNGQYANAGLSSNETSDYLQATDYDFAIPLTATITGIVVEIERRSSSNTGGNSVRDVSVEMLKGGAIVGSNYLNGADWPTTTNSVQTYGGATDLWGTTWTPAQINATNFGVSLSARAENSSRTAYVDFIRITVYYTNGPTITSFTQTSTCAGTYPTITINGTGFTGATAVTFFNGQAASFSVVSSTQITATVPAGATTGQISVTTPTGTATTASLTPSVFTVNPLPTVAAIGGPSSVCVNGTINLTDATSGGTWSSDTPLLASVSGTGVVTGLSAGAATIRYTYNNGTCSNSVTKNITVNALPVITAPTGTCMGTPLQISPVSGGTWSSFPTGIVNIDNAGNITPLAAGTTTLTYLDTTTNCSSSVSFVVRPLPSIASQPVSQSACTGGPFSFTVGAPVAGMTYQWYNGATMISNGGNISGADSATLTFSPVTVADSGNYHCEVSGVCSPTAISNTATLTVNEKITITAQPTVSQTLCTGSMATFSVTATGDSPAFQWYNGATLLSDGGNISGSTTNTLIISPLTLADASANYHCVVSGIGACLPVTSSNATLIVNEAPVINSQPVASNIVCDDDPVSLSIQAVGGSLIYQWYKGATLLTDGGNISGTNTDTLNFVPIHVGDAATDYYCVVTNACTSITSTMAEVIVNLKPKIPAQSVTICSNGSFTVNPVNGVPDALTVVPSDTTYTWGAPVLTGGMTGGSAQTSQQFISDSFTNPTNAVQTATYTVTPTSGTAGFCVGNPFTVTVYVNPVPDLVNANISVCSGEILNFIPANGGGNIVPAGTTYSWGIPVVTGGITGGAAGSAQTAFSVQLDNPTNTPQTATYTITPTSGACTGNSFLINVTVNPKPTLGINPASQSICASGAMTTIVLSNPNAIPGTVTYGWTRDNTANIGGIAASGTGDISGTLTNTTGVPQTTVFSIYAYSDNLCASLQGTASVTVSPVPIVTPVSNQTICSGDNITSINLGSSVTGTSFDWVRTNTTDLTGIPAVSSSPTISGALTNNTNVQQVTTFTVTPTANGCSDPSGIATFNITVNPRPTVSASPASQTVCGGSSFSITASNPNSVIGTVFSFTKDSTVSGDNVSITGNTISGSLENNGTTDRVVTFTITATAAGCQSSATVTVTVHPNPAFTVTPASQNVCSGVAMTTINLPVVAGVTYTWTRDNASITGLPMSMNTPTSNVSISGTLTNATTTNQTTTITITATTAANSCTKVRTVTITVYPQFVAPVIASSQSVCILAQPAALTITTAPIGGNGVYTYQWQRSNETDILTNTWTNVGSGTSYQPATIPLFGAQNYYYRLVVTTACGTFPASNIVFIQVVSNVGFDFDGVNNPPTQCPGGSFTTSIGTEHATSSSVRYSWTADANYISPATGSGAGTTSGIHIFIFIPYRNSSANLPFTVQNNTDATVTTQIAITPSVYDYPGPPSGAYQCNVSQQIVNVTIRPTPKVVLSASPTTICSGTGASILVDGNVTDAAMSFQWYRNNTTNVTGAPTGTTTTATTAPLNQFTINNTLTNITSVPQTVRYFVTPISNGCTGTQMTFDIIVAPAVTAGSIGANQSICPGQNPATINQITAGTPAGVTYQWQSSLTGSAGSWSDIPGETGTSYTPPAGLSQTTYYQRVASLVTNGVSCPVATTSVVVVVNSVTAGSVTGNTTICSGSGATITSTAPATGSGGVNYQWQYTTAGTGCATPDAGWTNVPTGGTGLNLTVTNVTATTYYRRRATSITGSCPAYSNCIVVTVNQVTGGTVGSDEILCGNNPAAFTQTVAPAGSGTLSYQWQYTTAGTGCATPDAGWTNIAIAGNGILYDAPAGVTVTTYYRRVTTSVLNGVSCTAVSNCITVTANNVIAGTIAPNSYTICSGGDPNAFNSATPGSGAGLTYQWQSSLTGLAGSWSDIPGAGGLTYDPPGPITQTTYFQRVAKATVGASTCEAASNTVTVFVNNVTAPVIAGDQNVCSEDPAAFTVSTAATGSGTLSYQWQYSTAGCGGPWTNIGTNSPTYDPPVLTQTTYYHVVVTSTLNAVQCNATSNCITVTSFAKVWNGSTSNDWNTAANWTPNGVPTSSHCVVIPNVSPQPFAVISGSNYIGYAKNLTVLNNGHLDVNPTNSIVVTDAVTVNVGGIFNILNSANLVQVNNVANTGIVTVQRITQPMYRFDYTYWNSPMVLGSYTLGNLSQNLTQPDKYYSWNPSISNGDGNWVQESTSTIMDPAKGYIVRAPNSFSFTPTFFQPYTATFTGIPNNGDVAIPIKIGTLGPATTNDKLNLIGNPFPSAVSAFDFVNDPNNVNLVEGTLYFWTHHAPPSAAFPNPFYGTFQLNYSPAGYASLNALGGTSTVPSGYGGSAPIDNIASGQSFFIVGKNTGTAYFRNSMRRTGNNGVFFRMSNPYTSSPTSFESHRIWLNLADTQGSFSQILVGYAEGATNGHDRNFDGDSFDLSGIALYSINEGRKYGIQGRALPFDVNDIVPLGINSTVNRTFTIGIDHLDGLFEEQPIYLEDKLLNVVHDIRESPYTFSTTAGTFDDRFLLRFTNGTLGVDNPHANAGLTAFIRDKKLHVQAGEDIRGIQVFDISGKLVRTYEPLQMGHMFEDEFIFAQGVYFAKIELGNGILATVKLSNGK